MPLKDSGQLISNIPAGAEYHSLKALKVYYFFITDYVGHLKIRGKIAAQVKVLYHKYKSFGLK